MSQETSIWLNQNTLIGFTTERGHAWHYRESEQGGEPNHYPGEIPIEDVRRRLFDWEAVEGTLAATVVSENGVLTINDPERKAIIRPDTETILGVFKKGYQIHQYPEWLLDQVAFLLDDDLHIGSAGLLRGGAQAWVQLEVPDTITTPEGVEFRPHLLAATSLDGSLATTYGRAVTNTVCDNTMSIAIKGMGEQKTKVKHSRYSKVRLADARAALAIVHETGEAFAAQVAELCATTVTEKQWTKFLEQLTPLARDGSGEVKAGSATTKALAKRDRLQTLYRHDDRVEPWMGTAYGVVQAVNTYTHHDQKIKGGNRAERNADRAVNGGIDKLDTATYDALALVLS